MPTSTATSNSGRQALAWFDSATDWLFNRDQSPDWWIVVLTGVLASAAIPAAYLALMQLREAERGRRAQLMPVLQFRRAALLPGVGSRKFVEVVISNFGNGPAIDVTFMVRVFPLPESAARDPAARDAFIKQSQSALGSTPPAGMVRVHGVPAAGDVISYVMDEAGPLIECPEAWAVVFMSGRYDDAFGARFFYPAARDDTKLGFIYRIAQLEVREPVLGGS